MAELSGILLKTESSKPRRTRMSEDGEGRREVSLAVIAKREAAIV